MNDYFENGSEPQEQHEVRYTDPNAGFDYNNYGYNVNNTEFDKNYSNNSMDSTPLSMGEWILTILALFIPCAGVIIYLVWAFGKKGNINRRNYCRAYLSIYAVIMAIYLVAVLVFGSVFSASF